MATKKSVYLSDELLSTWESIPTDQRSQVIAKALRDYAANDDNPELLEMRRIELGINNLTHKMKELEMEVSAKQTRLKEIRGGLNIMKIDDGNEWNEYLKNAKEAQENGTIWESYAGRAEYRIHDVAYGRVYIENLGTGRTTSNFQEGTFTLGLQRLMDRGGKIRQGDMIPVSMHEYAVVSLHPNLEIEGNYIVFKTELEG